MVRLGACPRAVPVPAGSPAAIEGTTFLVRRIETSADREDHSSAGDVGVPEPLTDSGGSPDSRCSGPLRGGQPIGPGELR